MIPGWIFIWFSLDLSHLGKVFPLTRSSLKPFSYWGNSTNSLNHLKTSSWVQLWTNRVKESSKKSKERKKVTILYWKHGKTQSWRPSYPQKISNPSKAPPKWYAGLRYGVYCVCWPVVAAAYLQWWTTVRNKEEIWILV